MRRECRVCGRRLRQGQVGLGCVSCGERVHQRCSGLNRWHVRLGHEWKCDRCGGSNETSGGQRAGSAMLNAGKCDKCGRARRRGGGIECRSCKKVLHVVCAELGSRTQAERVNRSDWVCKECVAQRERVETKERTEEVPVRLSDNVTREGPPTITVVQWNCDHLRAKIPELEVWLRKYDVDVMLIQETKLREEDGEVA